MIFGGGDIVVDWVNELELIVVFVIVLYCCEEFGGLESSVVKMKWFFVWVFVLYCLKYINGIGEWIESVIVC